MITQKAFAKLNFNLHVLPELLPNGYHQIQCLNFESDLADIITLSEIPKGIILTCDDRNLAVDEKNLAYKAAKLIMEMFHARSGIKININKQIPVTGGLGGGSSDGAAVINGLDKLWNLKLSNSEKIDLAKNLGMDVCYSVIGRVCKISGAGEIIESLNISFPGINMIIISPEAQKPSTAWAYKLLDQIKVEQNLDKLDKLIKAIKEKNLQNIADNLHNDFELPIIREFPEIAKIKAKMMENKALNTLLAGSGLSVFGIFETGKTAKVAFENLKKEYPKTYICKTI